MISTLQEYINIVFVVHFSVKNIRIYSFNDFE